MTDLTKSELRYERSQLFLIVGISIATLGLIGDEIAVFLQASEPVLLTFSVIKLGGWFLAIYALMRLRYLRDDMGKKGDFLTGVIDDERVQSIRNKAYSFGLTAALVWQILVIVGAPILGKFTGFTMTAVFAANVTICIAIVAATGRFLYLDRI